MTSERRHKPRLKLRYEIQLCSSDGRVLAKTRTEDLSSEGFYCNSDAPFSPGQRLECDLWIDARANGSSGANVILRRQVRVVRVEIRGLEPGFGVACQFEKVAGEEAPFGVIKPKYFTV